MKFYIDFEATAEQEIISIGVVSEYGETYYEYCKPQFSKLTSYISNLTGITTEKLENANSFEYAMVGLHLWLNTVEIEHNNYVERMKREFISYGNGDIGFLKASLKNIKYNADAYMLVCQIIATMQDYTEYTNKYFGGKAKLIEAYNFIQKREDKQRHNALEDAKMLAAVAQAIEGAEPLEDYPFNKEKASRPTSSDFKYPSGKFIARSTGKKPKIYKFNSCDAVLNWILNNRIPKPEREKVRKDKMVIKIMKSVKSKQPYMNYIWERIKED